MNIHTPRFPESRKETNIVQFCVIEKKIKSMLQTPPLKDIISKKNRKKRNSIRSSFFRRRVVEIKRKRLENFASFFFCTTLFCPKFFLALQVATQAFGKHGQGLSRFPLGHARLVGASRTIEQRDKQHTRNRTNSNRTKRSRIREEKE